LAQKAENHKKGVFFMKNTIKFLGIIALVAVIGFSIAACSNDPSYTLAPTSVVLAYGSHGEPSNVEIYDLMPGSRYVFTRGNNNNSWYALTASGEFAVGGTVWSLSQAIPQSANLVGTTVQSKLLNGQTYNIFRVLTPTAATFVDTAPAGADGVIVGVNMLGPGWIMDNRNDTNLIPAGVLDFDWEDGRNVVVELSGMTTAGNSMALRQRMSTGATPVLLSRVGDGRTTIIFLMPTVTDVIPGEAGTVVFDNVPLANQIVVGTTARWEFSITGGQAGGATLTAVAGDNFFTLSNVGDTRATLTRRAP
jgi:hypothetical protein